jgi:hypothetical protein
MAQMLQHAHDECSTLESWTCAWSTCQGLGENVERYRNSPLMHDSVPMECKPAMYDHSGNRIMFPRPIKAISKPRIHFAKKSEDHDTHLGADVSAGDARTTHVSSACHAGRGRSKKQVRHHQCYH